MMLLETGSYIKIKPFEDYVTEWALTSSSPCQLFTKTIWMNNGMSYVHTKIWPSKAEVTTSYLLHCKVALNLLLNLIIVVNNQELQFTKLRKSSLRAAYEHHFFPDLFTPWLWYKCAPMPSENKLQSALSKDISASVNTAITVDIEEITLTDHWHLPAAWEPDMIMYSFYGDSESCLLFDGCRL